MEATAAKLIGREKITGATAALFAGSVEVPERFLRTKELQAAGVVVGDDETFKLPVVNMAKLLDPELSASETAKLGSACRGWGFFQLTNHGVDEAATQLMKDSTAQFFNLPLESKNTVAVREGGFEGFGHHYNGSSSDKLDWAENLFLYTQPVQDRDMEFWPANPPTLRHALDRYSVEMTDLARRVLGFMAADLGVSRDALLGAFFSRDDHDDDTLKPKMQSVAMHHYPPCHHVDKVLGIAPHTDTLGLTFLLHADDTPGLQIKRGGRWFPVRPLPGAFVVNVGDILDVLTNGAYASVEHRVVPDAERGRTTVATFHDACVRGQVAPLPELLGVGGGEVAARYRSIGKLEFRKGSARATAQGTRFLDTIRM
ncbi:hypothetical protein SEVIR_9G373300v4 [Setaria viridis]|uniref:Fe2OG dioxygenase domain-containing protein n=1 Tax=Setaria viridis TaxID=4556 RepID=A0A4U6TEG4_SETVI|nr:S-norcoclaurine synthase 1-like [Setaria viridis]TKV95596.1 hypothetical protein SEVIR_9G373300v2 [Setaria viridis]